MQIDFCNHDDWNGFLESNHRSYVKCLLQVVHESDAEVCISFVSDEDMRELNRQYRRNNVPTDVLSFCLREGEPVGTNDILGDIVISHQTAVRQSQSFGHSIHDEINELIFHGMLHLLGYDHENDDKGWGNFEHQTIEALKRMKSPYVPQGMVQT